MLSNLSLLKRIIKMMMKIYECNRKSEILLIFLLQWLQICFFISLSLCLTNWKSMFGKLKFRVKKKLPFMKFITVYLVRILCSIMHVYLRYFLNDFLKSLYQLKNFFKRIREIFRKSPCCYQGSTVLDSKYVNSDKYCRHSEVSTLRSEQYSM